VSNNNPEVLAYRNPRPDRLPKGRIALIMVVWVVTILATLFDLMPAGTARTGLIYQSWFDFPHIAPVVEIYKEFRPGAPRIERYDYHWLNLLWNVLLLGGIWAGCIYGCRWLRRR
jgi:hypothetical protein